MKLTGAYRIKHIRKDRVKEYKLIDFKCGFCGFRFKDYVRFISGEKNKKSTGRNQIVCPKCSNYLPM